MKNFSAITQEEGEAVLMCFVPRNSCKNSLLEFVLFVLVLLAKFADFVLLVEFADFVLLAEFVVFQGAGFFAYFFGFFCFDH